MRGERGEGRVERGEERGERGGAQGASASLKVDKESGLKGRNGKDRAEESESRESRRGQHTFDVWKRGVSNAQRQSVEVHEECRDPPGGDYLHLARLYIQAACVVVQVEALPLGVRHNLNRLHIVSLRANHVRGALFDGTRDPVLSLAQVDEFGRPVLVVELLAAVVCVARLEVVLAPFPLPRLQSWNRKRVSWDGSGGREISGEERREGGKGGMMEGEGGTKLGRRDGGVHH